MMEVVVEVTEPLVDLGMIAVRSGLFLEDYIAQQVYKCEKVYGRDAVAV